MLMGKPNWQDENQTEKVSSNTPYRFMSMIQHYCSSGKFLLVPDGNDVEEFQSNAAKVWRRYHPVKQGRRSDAPIVYGACFELLEKGKISDKSTLAMVCELVAASLKENNLIPPHVDTIRVHIKAWRKQLKELIAKGLDLDAIRKLMSANKQERPYNALGAWITPRKKNR